VTLSLVGAARSSNLDGELRLLDAAGVVLATANPVDAIGATITATLPAAGTYYVAVAGVGKGDPLGTGYSDYGSLGLYAVNGVAPVSGAGAPPVAVLAAAPTRGTVPLTVAFDASGSSDPDGSIASIEWIFGDGTVGSGATTSKTYNSAGTFTAQLRVTDNSGLVATTSTTITVDPVVAVPVMRVADIGMSLEVKNNRQGRAIAVVTVRDETGAPVSGATVNGAWSGIVAGSPALVTDGAGQARFVSSWTRSSGTFTFRVTGVTRSGSTYDAGLNVETQDSIQR
jgi:PKD repeat protein